MRTYARFRRSIRHPSLEQGKLYLVLGPADPPPYLWVKAGGGHIPDRRCVDGSWFELVELPDELSEG